MAVRDGAAVILSTKLPDLNVVPFEPLLCGPTPHSRRITANIEVTSMMIS